jgi:hypothetical protein
MGKSIQQTNMQKSYYLPDLLFNPEDGGSTFPRNVKKLNTLQDITSQKTALFKLTFEKT